MATDAQVNELQINITASLQDMEKALANVGKVATKHLGKAGGQLGSIGSGLTKEFISPLQKASLAMNEAGFSASRLGANLGSISRYAKSTGGGVASINLLSGALVDLKKGTVTTDAVMARLASNGVKGWDLLAESLGTDVPTAMELVRQGAVSNTAVMDGLTSGLNRVAKQGTPIDQLKAKFTAMGGSLSKVGGSLTRNLTLPLAAAGAGLFAAASHAGSYAEEILNLSATTGVSTGRLQQLKFVAESSGLNFGTLSNGIAQVQKKLTGVEDDSGAAAEAFKRLGVGIYDSNGSLLSMDVLFPQLLAKLQALPNATERNMLASQVFGKGWTELAPILNMSGQQFDALANQATNLGLVLGTTALEGAAAFDDQIDAVMGRIQAMGLQIGAAAIPALESLMPIVVEKVLPALTGVINAVAGVAQWFAGLPAPAQGAIAAFGGILLIAGPLLTGLGGLATAISAIVGFAPALATAGVTMGTGFTAMLGPIGLVIAGITGLVALIVWLHKKFGGKKGSPKVEMPKATDLPQLEGMPAAPAMAIPNPVDFAKVPKAAKAKAAPKVQLTAEQELARNLAANQAVLGATGDQKEFAKDQAAAYKKALDRMAAEGATGAQLADVGAKLKGAQAQQATVAKGPAPSLFGDRFASLGDTPAAPAMAAAVSGLSSPGGARGVAPVVNNAQPLEIVITLDNALLNARIATGASDMFSVRMQREVNGALVGV